MRSDDKPTRQQSTARPPQSGTPFVLAMAAISCVVVGLASLPLYFMKLLTIPSSSMHPSLLLGDTAIVSKLAYSTTTPQQGDVAVVTIHRDDPPSTTFRVARVIGLPGDTIQMQGGTLVINGRPVPKIKAHDYVGPNYSGIVEEATCYLETLPNGVTYGVLDTEATGYLDDTKLVDVLPGHYFVLGDNRDNSADSRLPRELFGIGLVAEEELLGRIDRLFFALYAGANGRDRFGASIREPGCQPADAAP
ncbi:MAG: signal peptidase I [Hyphomicrobium sp.]|jgi:signal peptidase I